MTWEEKKSLEERESRRAVQKRQQMAACGQPMAPYNTTQFLMEQHEDADLTLEDKVTRHGKSEGSGSVESSDEYYESPNDEQEIFLEKDFTEAYESFHAERLQAMTKDELVREYLQLESKVETLECRLKDLGENNCERKDSRMGDEGPPKAEQPSPTSDLAPEMSAAKQTAAWNPATTNWEWQADHWEPGAAWTLETTGTRPSEAANTEDSSVLCKLDPHGHFSRNVLHMAWFCGFRIDHWHHLVDTTAP